MLSNFSKFAKYKMNSGSGIGGLSVGKDEYATDYFDLFKSVEIENSIADVSRIIIRPVNAAGNKGPFNFEMPSYFEKFTDSVG